MQAYTCVVVVNAIRWTGATPIFVDVCDDGNIDPNEVIKKVSKKSKVLIAQHTFGLPANMDRLLSIARENKIAVIEDCAHSLGATFQGKKVGILGDIGMFSFGNDKVVSCIRGGALVTPSNLVAEKISKLQQTLLFPKRLLVLRQLLYYPIFFIGKAWYFFGPGKVLLWLAKHSHLLPRVIEEREKRGERPPNIPTLFPNALAQLLLSELKRLETTNFKRRQIAFFYESHLLPNVLRLKNMMTAGRINLRYTLLVPEPKRLHATALKSAIMFGDWYDSVIVPKNTKTGVSGYRVGDCPRAEKLASASINLPLSTRLTIKDLNRIVNLVNSFYKNYA